MELTKQCLDCLSEKPLSAFNLCFSGKSPLNKAGYGDRNPVGQRQNRCRTCYGRRERAKMKLDFLHAYGNKCGCCGEDDQRFLTLDHVNDDGNVHRQKLNCQQIMRLARKQGFPPTYQVLCFNCNCGKSANGGVCPHQSGISKEQAWKMLNDRETYIGRDHVTYKGIFTGGYHPARANLHRRILKLCPYCGLEFGTHEMTRHKREKHVEEMAAKKAECLARGRMRS